MITRLTKILAGYLLRSEHEMMKKVCVEAETFSTNSRFYERHFGGR
jgi:hypothetical protein